MKTASPPTPWIRSPGFDAAFILAPMALPALAVVALRGYFDQDPPLPLWGWLVLVLGIDVAHVYATLYRTYADPEARARHATLLRLAPLLCWVAGVALYASDDKLFWSALAYLAIFHFIRQQYGFLRIYARSETSTRPGRAIDAAAIYLATLYPIVYWHAHLPRNFDWLISGDFIPGLPIWAERATAGLYVAALAAYAVKEILAWRKTRSWNWPKQLLLAGTALSWYVGIVWLNGDLAFTLTNVVAHGIPYVALVWSSGERRIPALTSRRGAYALAALPLFFGLLWLLAYVEEGLWHGLLWRDKAELFPWFQGLPALQDASLLAVLVPLLALPQATHYVLDGFIWRMRRGDLEWAQASQGEERLAA